MDKRYNITLRESTRRRRLGRALRELPKPVMPRAGGASRADSIGRRNTLIMFGSSGGIRREFPLVFSIRGFSGAWC